MARVCEVTGKKPMGGHKVSHSNIKTKRRFLPNLQTKRFFFAEEDRWITLKVSTDDIRTINKNGLASVIKDLRATGGHIQQQGITRAKKGNRVQVILECTEHKTSGQPGTSRYISTKNKKNTPERLELKKFNPILKKVTVHKEIK